MRFFHSMVFFLLVSQPTYADVDFRKDKFALADIKLISECLDKANPNEPAEHCVNLTYKPCTGRIGPKVSHADEGACNGRELDLWFHIYELEAKKIEAWSILKDRQVQEIGENGIKAHQQFQRWDGAWRKFIFEQCNFEMTHWAGGNARMTSEPHCVMRKIVAKLIKMRELQGFNVGAFQP